MHKRNKVLFLLTNKFTNDSRVLKEGTSLVNAGYDVTLVCLIGDGLPEKEVINGIKVNRLDFYNNSAGEAKANSENLRGAKTADSVFLRFKRFLKSAIPPMIFMVESKILSFYRYMKFSYRICARFHRDTDVVHCHDLDTLPIGVLLKIYSFGKTIIVYDAHEYETEVGFSVVGLKKLAYQITERICIKFANAVITVSEGIAGEYVRLYKIKKPTVLLNTPVLKEPNKLDIFRKELKIGKDQQIFLYQGGLSRNRGIEIIIDAFQKLSNTNKVIVFLGYGELEDQIKEIAKKSTNIYFYPAVAPEVLLDYTASADIGIAIIENSCLSYYYCLPNKLFEYTMAKIPTMVSNLFELKKFIEANGNGVVIKETTAECLTETIQKITVEDIERMKSAAEMARQRYHWEYQEEKLLKLYAGIQ